MATRCFWPPESCARVRVHAVGKTDAFEKGFGFFDGFLFGDAGDFHGIAHIGKSRALGKQVEILEDHGNLAARFEKLLFV